MKDKSFDEEIAQLEAANRELAVHRDQLRAKLEAINNRAAYYSHLVKQNRQMKRDIAELEGRPYRDEEDPDGADYPEAPDPPEENP